MKVAVGVDHSKFNQIYTQNVASIEDIDILISDTIDRKIYKNWKIKFQKLSQENEVFKCKFYNI
ncbi:hypothetical protein SDC49_10370 [Lactobacillus sp. R2/2]|nr:hypothetical protein [Lactobacillus sp. R2/2]